MPLAITHTVPDASTRAEILALAGEVERADGAPPLSDQSVTQLSSAQVVHLLVREGTRLRGYAQLDHGGAEILARSASVARQLLDEAAVRAAADGTANLSVWAHGRRSRVGPVLSAAGYDATRELHQLRRPLGPDAALPSEPELADGIEIRPFAPGHDDAAWLEINAAAFASHPEQGGWTDADLQARVAEPWFDPAAFLLAERDGRLLGYHWTKTHPDGAGEVYVLGVAPRAQGLGLGRVLLLRGLEHLSARGCPYVLLYVDGDNAGAMRLYERDGFARYDLDIQWRSPAPTVSA